MIQVNVRGMQHNSHAVLTAPQVLMTVGTVTGHAPWPQPAVDPDLNFIGRQPVQTAYISIQPLIAAVKKHLGNMVFLSVNLAAGKNPAICSQTLNFS